MCGICGFVDLSGKTTSETLQKMTGALKHRGPDDFGYSFDRKGNVLTGLGHRRLAILDLSPLGHQPMKFENLEIIFNGEIYNFQELRSQLEDAGYAFSSKSDTEVIIKAFHCWGIDAVKNFNGMFAIVIYDKDKNKFYLIRDRAGVKPLFWHLENGLLLFASELKSFHEHPRFRKKIDLNSLALYLKHGFIPQPYSIFQNTRKLMAGHFLEFDVSSFCFKEIKYWDIVDFAQKPRLKISYCEALDKTREILTSACEYRMVSDVPVGVFLSGGYDSTAVAAIIQKNRTEKLKTITIGFHEEDFNEAHHAKRVADYLDTDHSEYYCSIKDAFELLPKIPEIWDEPIADTSMIPTALVCLLASKKTKVCLSADGGDEIFGGYGKYITVKNKLIFQRKVPEFFSKIFREAFVKSSFLGRTFNIGLEQKFERFSRTAELLRNDPGQILAIVNNIYLENDIQRLIKKKFVPLATFFDQELDAEVFSYMQAIDFSTYMVDDILVKVDRAAMNASLESREPLLDYRLVEFLAQLPDDYKIHNGERKRLLKEIVHQLIPQNIMNREKMGFGIPLGQWFRKELSWILDHYLDPLRLKAAEIFSVSMLMSLKKRFLDGDDTCFDRLWLIIVFEMWRERWSGQF